MATYLATVGNVSSFTDRSLNKLSFRRNASGISCSLHRSVKSPTVSTFNNSRKAGLFQYKKSDDISKCVVVTRASESGTADSVDPEATVAPLVKTLQLGSLFGLWYLFNIYFNIYNKQVAVYSNIC